MSCRFISGGLCLIVVSNILANCCNESICSVPTGANGVGGYVFCSMVVISFASLHNCSAAVGNGI